MAPGRCRSRTTDAQDDVLTVGETWEAAMIEKGSPSGAVEMEVLGTWSPAENAADNCRDAVFNVVALRSDHRIRGLFGAIKSRATRRHTTKRANSLSNFGGAARISTGDGGFADRTGF
jgi:hypothetical protein